MDSSNYIAEEDGSDDEYGRPRRKSKPQVKRPLPHTEVGRTTRHTLDENLDQMMSGSFDASFLSGGDREQCSFSPRMDTGFDFGDSDGFGFGDIGDELAKELGEGWASAPFQPKLVLSSQPRGKSHGVPLDLLRMQSTNFLSVLTRQT